MTPSGSPLWRPSCRPLHCCPRRAPARRRRKVAASSLRNFWQPLPATTQPGASAVRRHIYLPVSQRTTVVVVGGGGKGERATTLSSQTTGQRAGSVHLVEKLCSFVLLDIQKHSWRASGQEGPRGIGSGCEAHSARTRHNTTSIKQGYKWSALPNSPWSPSQEGARGQGSSACRGTPSRGEARAFHSGAQIENVNL